jgi:hypothetical protein
MVERVQDPAAARHAQIELHVPLGVPAERPHPPLVGHRECVEHRGEPPRTGDHVGPGGGHLTGRRGGDDAFVSEELLHPPHQDRYVQGCLLHQTAHHISSVSVAPVTQGELYVHERAAVRDLPYAVRVALV